MYELVLQFLTQIFGLMYSVLTEDLSDFSPHAYEYISILNTILKGFASSLMLIAFCVGYIQSAVSLIEQKTPIAVFKTLARLVIVNALVVRGTDIILMPMFSVVRSLTSRLIEAMGGQAGLLPNIDESSPGGVAGAIEECLKAYYPDVTPKIIHAEGLAECKKTLALAKAGKMNGCLIEGMGCPGGCIAGAGTNLPLNKAAAKVKWFKSVSSKQLPPKELAEIELK